jgi:hypothetical protein
MPSTYKISSKSTLSCLYSVFINIYRLQYNDLLSKTGCPLIRGSRVRMQYDPGNNIKSGR